MLKVNRITSTSMTYQKSQQPQQIWPIISSSRLVSFLTESLKSEETSIVHSTPPSSPSQRKTSSSKPARSSDTLSLLKASQVVLSHMTMICLDQTHRKSLIITFLFVKFQRIWSLKNLNNFSQNMERLSHSRYHSTLITLHVDTDLFAFRIHHLPPRLFLSSKQQIASRQSSINLVTSVSSERSTTTFMPKTSLPNGMSLRLDSFSSNTDVLNLFTVRRVKKELMLSFVSTLKIRVIVSMDLSVLRPLFKHWMELQR